MANAYAQQFIAWRTKNEQAEIANAVAVLSSQIKVLETNGQRSSSDYAILTADLQDLQIRSATATGDFIVLAPATTPTAPYAPTPKKSGILGLGVGILVGLGVAALREKLDTRLRSHRDVAEMLDLPIVGRIPTISGAVLAKSPLVVLTESDGSAANAMRILRTNIEYTSLGEEHRVLMIASPLQGEGKSLTIANLAVSLTLAGKNVLLIDGDLRRPHLHQLFGVRNVAGISSVIAGQVKLVDAIQPAWGTGVVVRTPVGAARERLGPTNGAAPSLSLLPAGPAPPNPGEMVGSQRFASLMSKLKAMPFDLLLVDSPAFLAVGDALALAADVEGVLLLVNLKKTRRPILEEAKELLAAVRAHKLGIVTVNDDLGREERYRQYSQQ